MLTTIYKSIVVLLVVITIVSCKKLVKIPEPINSITTSETFSTDALAIAAVGGIYYDMINKAPSHFARGYSTFSMGMSADELIMFAGATNFQTNTLLSTDVNVSPFWNSPYYDIYLSNAILEGLQASTSVSDAVKKQLTGEAKFIRAFCYFYLVNLFGDVPLVLSTSWASTSLLPRTSTQDVYVQIKADLNDAIGLLSDSYLKSDNSAYTVPSTAERTRANKSAAMALLARVDLYTLDYQGAESMATTVLNNTTYYNLLTAANIANVFKANSGEAIWQLQPSTIASPYTVYEGNQFTPTSNTSTPYLYLTSQLLAAFEAGDKRKTAWISSTTSGTTFYYPYKYQVRQGTSGVTPTEYYMMLRLAEQYLIRAEARAKQNTNLAGAITDLNTIRLRAGLTGISTTSTQAQVLAAIMQERRIEFFAEWGHRWLDLKRTGQADSVLAPLKPAWQPTAKLYPIPYTELQNDPNLVQNSGY